MMPAAVLQLIIVFKVGLVLQEIFTECIVIELLIKIVDSQWCGMHEGVILKQILKKDSVKI